MKIDGILFLGYRHSLFLRIMFKHHSRPTATLLHSQARAALKLQLWEVGTVGEHRCRGLAQNHWDLNVWNLWCSSSFFIVSFGKSFCGRCNAVLRIFTSQHSGAMAILVLERLSFKSGRITIEWFDKTWKRITAPARTGLSLYTAGCWFPSIYCMLLIFSMMTDAGETSFLEPCEPSCLSMLSRLYASKRLQIRDKLSSEHCVGKPFWRRRNSCLMLCCAWLNAKIWAGKLIVLKYIGVFL